MAKRAMEVRVVGVLRGEGEEHVIVIVVTKYWRGPRHCWESGREWRSREKRKRDIKEEDSRSIYQSFLLWPVGEERESTAMVDGECPKPHPLFTHMDFAHWLLLFSPSLLFSHLTLSSWLCLFIYLFTFFIFLFSFLFSYMVVFYKLKKQKNLPESVRGQRTPHLIRKRNKRFGHPVRGELPH